MVLFSRQLFISLQDFRFVIFSYVETDSFGIENTLAESASVNLEVKVQDFPKDKNVTFSNLQIGQPANLSLKMDIYPEPKNEDYDWTIYDKSTNTKIEVKTGMH